MGSSKQTNKSVQTTTPYGVAQGGIDAAVGGINGWMSSPGARATYTGDRVADMSDMTRSGLAEYGAGTGARTAANYYTGMLGSGPGGSNPYIDQMRQAIESSVMPSVNNTFSQAGMSGSTLHQGSLARGLSDGMADVMFNAYESDQNRKMQAAGALPGVDERIGQRMIEAGQIGEGYTQRELDAQRQAFEEKKYAGLQPYATALPLLSGVGSQFGTTNSTQTSKTKPSLGQSILGGGMMLAGLGTGGMGNLGAAASGFASGGLTGAQQGWAGMHNPAFWAPRGA